MHGSHTYIGRAFDTDMIGFVAVACYDIIVSNFPGNSPILKQLSLTPRNHTFDEVTTNLLQSFIDKDPESWIKELQTADIQTNYFIVFSAITACGLSVVFPWEITEKIVTWAINAFPLIEQPVIDFVLNDFMPELQKSVSGIHLTFKEKKVLGERIVSIVLKAAYAFTFQEKFFPLPFLYHWIPMEIAAHSMPVWNRVANWLSDFAQTDDEFNHAV